MTGLSETISHLTRLRRVPRPGRLPVGQGELTEIADFGGELASNPGNLRMMAYVPAKLAARPALVIVLHGCGQDAASFATASGWIARAERQGFIICAPEQRSANNSNGCFNWFYEDDVARNQGEAASIRQMVEWLRLRHPINRKRIFVTGLSAGGAMANALLAAYPETFAAGSIIAGLPYGVASSVKHALTLMREAMHVDPWVGGDAIRMASAHHGPFPRVLVMQGADDTIVAPANADAIAQQWRDVHGLEPLPALVRREASAQRTSWGSQVSKPSVEHVLIDGLGHGVPVLGPVPGVPVQAHDGKVDPFVVANAFDSTQASAAFFGLDRPASAEPSFVPTFMRKDQ